MENKIEELEKAKQESDKRLLNIEIVLGLTTTFSFLTIFFMSIYAIVKLNIIAVPAILMALSFVVLISGIVCCLIIEQKAGYYKCKKCHEKYVPTFKQSFLAPHMGRTRYMRCPHCQKKSWNKKVVK